jgi:multicomponent K+:H+ antiporter subunit E
MTRAPGRRLLPAPLLSLALFVGWLMLSESASVGQMLLAAALAVTLPWFSQRFEVAPTRIGRWGAVARLALVVLRDIIAGNIDVARRVLGPLHAIQSRFVWVPLSIEHPHAIVTLAGIVTMTPGTLSSVLSDDRRHLLVHALHCPDDAAAAALVAEIKQRYEQPLGEIFT